MARKIFFILLTLAVMGVWTAGVGMCAGKKVIELTYANFVPPTQHLGVLADSFCKEIEKRTEGRVKISHFPGGTLLKGNEMYDGVLKGVADIGLSCFAYTRGRFPSIEAVDLPLGYPSGDVATAVINEFYKKFRPKELDDVKILYLHAHGPGILHSKKPIRKLEDLKGLKVRCTGLSAKVAQALGAAPVAMPQGGTYEALQKGVVEATFSPYEVLSGWKHGEVIKYTVECYSIGYTTGFFVVMNKDKWNSLPADVKKIFEEMSEEWIAKTGESWDEQDRKGKEFSLGLGNEVISLSPEESARWTKAVQPIIDEYITATEKKGLPAKKYVKTIKKLIKQYEKQ